MKKIKNCKVCNVQPLYIIKTTEEYGTQYKFQCPICSAFAYAYGSEDEAVEFWNKHCGKEDHE